MPGPVVKIPAITTCEPPELTKITPKDVQIFRIQGQGGIAHRLIFFGKKYEQISIWWIGTTTGSERSTGYACM